MMVNNDLTYYVIPNSIIEQSFDDNNAENAIYGIEKLTFDENGKPVITVQAMNFPVLIHELIKGVLELIATLALPDDKTMLEYVYDQADNLKDEVWYLRLGPVLWERFAELIPPEYNRIKAQLIGKVFEQPTTDFNIFMQSVLSDTNQYYAVDLLNEWGKDIIENIRTYNQDHM